MLGLAKGLQGFRIQIEDPVSRDTGACVGGALATAVVGERGVGDLADEQGSIRMGIAVVARTASDDGDIGLWLEAIIETEGELETHGRSSTERSSQGIPDQRNRRGMAALLWGHIDQLPVEELQVVFRAEDTRVYHALELGAVEAMPV